MEDPFAGMDPIERLKLELEVSGQNRNATELASSQAGNLSALWDMTPVVGNVRSLQDSFQAGREAGDAWDKGDARGALLGRIEQALGVAGAAVPGMGPGKNAKNRLNVLIPARDNNTTELAREMRSEGEPIDRIWKQTQRAIGAEGGVRQEIPDTGLKLHDMRPGERPLGEAVEHRQLFDRMPQLADIPLKVFDTTHGSQPHAYSKGGTLFMTSEHPDAAAQIAKLLQYDIQKTHGLNRAIGHGDKAVTEGFEDADILAQAASRRNISAGDRASLMSYRQHLNEPRDTYEMQREIEQFVGGRGTRGDTAASKTGRKSAGNAEAAFVKARVGMSPDNLKSHPYSNPYGMNLPTQHKQFVLPQPGTSPEDMLEFARQWRELGTGRLLK